MTLSLISLIPSTALMALSTMMIQRKHLLMALLALEAMILSIIMSCTLSISKLNPSDTSLILILLTMGACEACLGLSCLISLIRFKGNDMIKSTTSSMC